MILIIVRHGESEGNLKGYFEGTGDLDGSKLTTRGRLESTRLARYLSDSHEVDHIFSSPSLRTRQTAKILGEVLNSPIVIAGELREIDCGDWTGQKFTTVQTTNAAIWTKWKEHPTEFKFPGGESLACVGQRVQPFIDRLLANAQARTVLLVSHSATISVMLTHLFAWDLEKAWTDKRSYHSNSAYTILEKLPTQVTLHSDDFGLLPA